MSKRTWILVAVLTLVVIVGLGIRIRTPMQAADGAWKFSPPSQKQRRAAIGSTRGATKTQRRAFDPDEHFRTIPSPGPSDWLANQREAGQTFDQYLRGQPNRPDQRRNKIYLQPIGDFPEDTSPDLDRLKEFAEPFFGLKVQLNERVALDGLPIKSRHGGGDYIQLLSTDVLDWLKTRVPNDAYCLLAVTMDDLYPKESWNFVFGQASLRERVGVYSFARYSPSFYGRETDQDSSSLVLLRSCKVLAHETGHMFGIAHCIHFHCLMNGSNHLDETDRAPIHLCPVCLRKLHHATGFDLQDRYRQLGEFAQGAGWSDEQKWLEKRLQYIEGTQ